jgi:hypothetical protein
MNELNLCANIFRKMRRSLGIIRATFSGTGNTLQIIWAKTWANSCVHPQADHFLECMGDPTQGAGNSLSYTHANQTLKIMRQTKLLKQEDVHE